MRTKTGELKLRKRELFASLGYQPHEGQILVHKSKAPRRVLACGVRWGKSTCSAMEAVAALCEPRERTKGWIVVPTYDLGRSIFDLVAHALDQEFRHRVIDLNPREQRVILRNFGAGVSELRVKSADNPVSLLGQAIDFAIVDEAARLPREIWQQHVSQRLIDRQGWALLVSTPRGPGWFFKLYQRGQSGRDQMFESWSSPSWTNPHLNRSTVEEERRTTPPEVFAQEYEAKFVGVADEDCDVCGWPDPMACSVILVRDEHEPIPKCPQCGRYVDKEGHTSVRRMRDGRAHLTRILVMPRETEPGS